MILTETQECRDRIARERERWIEAWLTRGFGPAFVRDFKSDPVLARKMFAKWGVVIKKFPDHDELWNHGGKQAAFAVTFINGHMNITADYPPGFRLTE